MKSKKNSGDHALSRKRDLSLSDHDPLRFEDVSYKVDERKNLIHISRRQLLLSVGVFAATSLADCRKNENVNFKHGARVNGSRRIYIFNEKEVSVLNALIAIVLPISFNNDCGVIDYLDNEVGTSADLHLFRKGINCLDKRANAVFRKGFTELSTIQQNELIDRYTKDQKNTHVAVVEKKFFQRLRYYAFKGFYGSRTGWSVVGYQGPPQCDAKPFAMSQTVVRKKEKAVDVCIVGSGAGGAVVAYELCRAGVNVALLERGRYYRQQSDFIATQPNWEQLQSPLWASSSGSSISGGSQQKLDERYRHLLPDFDETAIPSLETRERLKKYRGPQRLQAIFGVGGTTLVAEAQCTRYGDETFKERSIDGVGANWPISYEEIQGDYDAIEEILGVSGDREMPSPPRKAEYPNQPHPLSAASRIVEKGCKKMGLHLYPQASASPSRAYRGRPACRGCSCCMLGCGYDAKGSAESCFIRPALKTGRLNLIAGNRCLHLEPDSKGKISSVVFMDERGKVKKIKARVVVLAAGAVETPRILLSSVCGRWPHGAANYSGMVGRNYQETLFAASYGLTDAPLKSYRGVTVDNVVVDFLKTRRDKKYVRGFSISSCAAGMNLLGPAAYALQAVPGWGMMHEAFMRRYFGHALVVQAAGEQLASDKNMVELDTKKKDCHGYPVMRVLNHLGENDLLMLDSMVATLHDLLVASGAKRIRHNNSSYVSRIGAEPRGTCRMGDEPNSAVVDSFCRSHEVPNLFITDASVLAGGMHGNISLTIQALARRASRDLLGKISRKEL